jgi:P4 family phage/plasmid primase-like protien
MQQAIEFLEKLRPGGPWVLSAIVPDGAITTVTVVDGDAVRAFIRDHNGRRNLYYSVNPTRTAMTSKAAKADIAAVEYLLADLDPRDGETPDAAKARYLAQLENAFEPGPTAIVDSGNGIQCLWRLAKRIELPPGAEATIADVEARTAAVMLRLGSKAGTQNIDRILRLPGTTNLPNATKLKAGRVACPTALLWFNGAIHPLTAFPKPEVEAGSTATDCAADASLDATLDMPPRLATMLSVTGSGAYLSRSELLFAFLAEALRLRIADAVVVRSCLDAAHAGCGIFEHCKENGGKAYVERQIKQAREKVGEVKQEMLTDLGNARRLVRLHGADIRYVHSWRKWVAWENCHWQKDGDGSVVRMAKATIEEMFVEAARINDDQRRNAMRSYALKSQAAQRLAAMVDLAKTEKEVVLAVEKLDADPLLLGVKNGVINLRTGTFRQAQREDYTTKIAGAAFNAKAECANWIAFLNKAFTADADLIAYVQRSVGYTLTGQTGEEVLFVLWGDGDNGKTTFRETLFALLGDYAVGADASLLITNKKTGGATPELARLHGRRLVTVNETEEGDRLNESRVKFITSHDIITARNLYEEPFDFPPTHKTFLTTNHKPIVRGADKGIWKRIHLWPFVYTFTKEERVVNFREQMLTPELPGILNWALAGLEAYRRVGLSPPKVVQEAIDEYREDMDIVGRWIEERCVRDQNAKYATSVLHFDYQEWARDEVGFIMSAVAFGRELSSRGFAKIKVEGTNKRGIGGLKLRRDVGAVPGAPFYSSGWGLM